MIMVPLLASFHDAANGASRAASLNRRQSSSNCCCTSSTEGSNGWLPTSAWSRLRDHNTSCLRATEADSRGGAGMAVGYKASVAILRKSRQRLMRSRRLSSRCGGLSRSSSTYISMRWRIISTACVNVCAARMLVCLCGSAFVCARVIGVIVDLSGPLCHLAN